MQCKPDKRKTRTRCPGPGQKVGRRILKALLYLRLFVRVFVSVPNTINKVESHTDTNQRYCYRPIGWSKRYLEGPQEKFDDKR